MISIFRFKSATIAALALALSSSIVVAQDHDRHDRDDDHDRSHGHEYDRGHDRDHDRAREHEHEISRHEMARHEAIRHEAYVDHDRDIRSWYRVHHEHLPPGLAMRDRLAPGLERQLVIHGYLPVELRHRMQPCPRELEVMLPPPAPGFAHVFIGGNLVLVNRANFQVVDVFHFNLN